MDINIRICGEAGQGVQTTGGLLVRSLVAAGLRVFTSQSYMSRIRGGANAYDVRVSETELFGGRPDADLLVAFTDEALEHFRAAAGERALVIRDGAAAGEVDGVVTLPFTATAKKVGGSPVMAGTVVVGAILKLLGLDTSALTAQLERQFGKKKGAEVAKLNVACAEAGAAMAGLSALGNRLSATQDRSPVTGHQSPSPELTVVSGSEAVGLGAAVGGVKFAASYPMTPSTGVFTWLAQHADEYRIVVEQAEDEIAAINMICGAAYAGAPAMTTTSGGGFALMCEGLALAGMLELPVLVMDGQRPGPATGLPTRTGQEDLKMVVHAGHGEFPRAVFAPGTHEQCFRLLPEALETAARFQTPVIFLLDQFLADAEKDLPAFDRTARPVDRHVLLSPGADYRRYEVTESGVSPRALPGSGPFVVADSDEHTEDGHITEDLAARVRLQDKRLRKGRAMLGAVISPEVYPGPGAAGEALLCWGSTYGPCREAVDLLRAGGRDICMVHFAQVWPIDPAKAGPLLAGRRVWAVEGNATAQFASLLAAAGALERFEPLLRYDGLPFTGWEIAGRASQ